VRIRTKRVYEAPSRSDGRRILVDRLWPRGLAREAARVDFWARSVAPSDGLRRWYRHDPAKWERFRQRYFGELDANPEGVVELREQLGRGTTTLLFASKETRLNNASVLREYLESPPGGGRPDRRPAGSPQPGARRARAKRSSRSTS
jgi:uncharacterized protein YeaO (DUF488 family)